MRKRLKRAGVSSAPAAPRRGVTSEIGDGITQQPRLLARSGGQGERTRGVNEGKRQFRSPEGL